MKAIALSCIVAQLVATGLAYKLASDDATSAVQSATAKRAAVLAQAAGE